MPRLKNLKIDEVSSVDVGAGRGVRVLLMKSATKRNDDMDTSNLRPMIIAKRAHSAVSNGEMSEYAFGKAQQQLAELMGLSLAEFFETPAGLATLAPRTALSAAQNLELMKRESGNQS
jgi:hypothetical protein